MSCDHYRTKDLYYAAYLRVAGISLVDTVREGRQVYFLFDDPGNGVIPDLKKAYFSDKAKVPAMSFVQAIRMMKTLVHTT